MKKLVSITLTLILSLQFTPQVIFAQAQTLKAMRTSAEPKRSKLSPDLEDLLTQDDEARYAGMTLAELRKQRLTRTKGQQHNDPASVAEPSRQQISGVVLPSEAVGEEEKQSFIVQLENTASELVLREKVARLGGRVNRQHGQMGLLTIEAPRSVIRQLAADGSVAYVSPDRAVTSFGHVDNTIGYLNSGIKDAGDSDPNTWLDGKGVSVAVIDSGIQSAHSLMSSSQDNTKVYYQKDFTGQAINDDPYGHGSHVATLLGGTYISSTYDYEGSAPGAKQLSLRVLNDLGLGSVSNVIAALDWCVANKAAYNIRVINLSLGTPAKDSYQTDPLCLAARRAWNAGIVVVAAAGNVGKDLLGNKLYGGIHSPGIEPSVITVGAANTFGTSNRSDDTVATFSSRGPTRGYTIVNGVKKYDNLIKPDLIAPGNKLIGARAYYNNQDNLLARLFPSLKTGSKTAANDRLMYLSGTSMAAPVVAGAAAVLLQQNPNLTPNLVKAILMYTAQPLNGFNTLEQGAGELNVDGAVRLTRLVKTTLPTSNGTALLSAALPSAQSSVISGETCYWSKGVITNYGFLSGNELMTKWQGMYANGVILGDATSIVGGVLTKSSTLTTAGATLYSGAITNNGVILGDGTLFASGIILGDGTSLGQGIIIGDGTILGDGVILGDSIAFATQTVLGDNTTSMPSAP